MMAESSDAGRDGLVLEHFGWEDLDMETFSAFQALFRARKPDHPFAALDNEGFLKSLRGWATDRERGTRGLTLAGLLGRNPESLRNRFLAPMVQERLLERRFPTNPNHEQQAYRAIPRED